MTPLANRTLPQDVLEQALHATDIMVVLTDPHLPDNPIVWVNDYFCTVTGYGHDEVLGRNCRFLQGDDRDQGALDELRAGIREERPVNVLLRNYRKDGTMFENDLFVSPVREDRHDPASRVLYFIGVQNDSTALITAERALVDREREVQETAENERERFGMDLHDGLGQELYGVRLLLGAHVARLRTEGSEQVASAERAAELLDRAITSARSMARGLNPIDVSAHGFGDALEVLCKTVEEASGGMLRVEPRIEAVHLPDRRAMRHLYRIAQEALSNAVRHAQATAIQLTLHRTPTSVHLEVRDDGVGISEETRHASRPDLLSAAERTDLARRGMGLFGMRHRADLIGARLIIQPNEGGGTVVRCILPTGPTEAGGTGAAQHMRTGERN